MVELAEEEKVEDGVNGHNQNMMVWSTLKTLMGMTLVRKDLLRSSLCHKIVRSM